MSRFQALSLVGLCAAAAGSATTARAEPSKAACIDANTGAQSLRREGRFSETRVRLRECLDPACPQLVRSDCAERLDELDREQPTLTLHVEGPSGGDLANVSITIDGQPLAGQEGATAIALDPGPHRVVFEATGLRPTTRVFVLSEGDKGRRERVVLEPVERRQPRTVGQRSLGLIIGGVGVAAMAAGATFAALVSVAKHDYEQHCGSAIGAPASFCDAQGVRGHDDAVTKASFATGFLIAGGAAFATGVALVLTAAPKRTSTAMTLGLDGVSFRQDF